MSASPAGYLATVTEVQEEYAGELNYLRVVVQFGAVQFASSNPHPGFVIRTTAGARAVIAALRGWIETEEAKEER